MVAQAGVRLSAPWIEDGVVWWLEGRAAETGRVVLVRHDRDGEPVDVVPAGFNVRTSVHEYGGGAYCIHAASRSARASTTSASTVSIRARSPCRSRPTCRSGATATRTGASRRTGRSGSAFGSGTPRATLRGRRQRARRRCRRTGPRSRASSPAGATSTPTRASRPTARVSASSPGTCPGCRGTAASSTSPTSLRTAISRDIEHVAGADGRSRSGSPSGARRATSCSRAIGAAGGTSSASATVSARALHAARGRVRLPRVGRSERRSYAFLGDGRIVCGYEYGGFTHFGVLDPETGRARAARPRPRLVRDRRTSRRGTARSASSRDRRHVPNADRPSSTSRPARSETLRTSIESALLAA